MDPQKNDRELEELLERALHAYSDAEPSWGFEERILARAREQKPRRWWVWWPVWAAAVAAVVIAVVLPVALRTPRQTTSSETKIAKVQQPQQEVAPYVDTRRNELAAATPKEPAREKKGSTQRMAKAARPNADSYRSDVAPAAPTAQSADMASDARVFAAMKKEATPLAALKAKSNSAREEEFPKESPMTAQERVLLRWANSQPHEAATFARSESPSQEDKPLSIEQIRIEPLKVPEIGGELK